MGKSAIYLQYSQVRANLRKLLENKKITRKFTKFNDDERNLAKEIINFNFSERTLDTLEPHHLAEYGYALCQSSILFIKIIRYYQKILMVQFQKVGFHWLMHFMKLF